MVNEKILVVEDEKITGMDIQSTLENMGYNVIGVASTGEEAIEKISNLAPDLILMDIVLKGTMTGLDVAEYVMNNHNIPVVYLTAHADDLTMRKAKTTVPYGYIIKPYEKQELQMTVEMAIYNQIKCNILRESEEKYRNIVKFANDGISIIQDGIIRFVNPRFAKMCGYEKNELIGKPFTDYLHPDEIEKVQYFDRLRIESKDQKTLHQTILMNRNREKLPVELNIVEIPYKCSYADLVVVREITQRKQS